MFALVIILSVLAMLVSSYTMIAQGRANAKTAREVRAILDTMDANTAALQGK